MITRQKTHIGDRYQVVSLLGEGAMGSVYLCTDTRLKRDVAIKVIKATVTDNEAIVQRMVTEGKILSELRHESLASVYEMATDKGEPFIVQEFIAGESLESLIETGQSFTNESAWRLLRELAEVLGYLHSQGIYHRDIKPANIMINGDGRAVLMDFGLALDDNHTRLTQEGSFVGTICYCAPEVLQGNDGKGPGDIYQLGLIIYEAVNRKSIFGHFSTIEEFIDIVTNQEWAKKCFDGSLDDDLAEIVSQMVSYEAHLRPQDGNALLSLIQEKTSCPQKNDTFKKDGACKKNGALKKNDAIKKTTKKKLQQERTARRNTKSQQVPPVQSGTHRHRTRAPAVFVTLVIVMLFGWVIFFRAPERKSTTKTTPNLMPTARAWVYLPDGPRIFLPSTAGDNLQWEVTVPEDSKPHMSAGRLSGAFLKVAGGWKATILCRDLSSSTDERILKITDNGTVISSTRFQLPTETMHQPLAASFSYDTINMTWQLNENSPVKLTFFPVDKTGRKLPPVLSKTLRGNKITVPVQELGHFGQTAIDLRLTEFDDSVVSSVSGNTDFEVKCQIDPGNPLESFEKKAEGMAFGDDRSREAVAIDAYEKRLYLLARSGVLYSFTIDNTTDALFHFNWKRTITATYAFDIEATENGVDVYIFQQDYRRLSYSHDGSSSVHTMDSFPG